MNSCWIRRDHLCAVVSTRLSGAVSTGRVDRGVFFASGHFTVVRPLLSRHPCVLLESRFCQIETVPLCKGRARSNFVWKQLLRYRVATGVSPVPFEVSRTDSFLQESGILLLTHSRDGRVHCWWNFAFDVDNLNRSVVSLALFRAHPCRNKDRSAGDQRRRRPRVWDAQVEFPVLWRLIVFHDVDRSPASHPRWSRIVQQFQCVDAFVLWLRRIGRHFNPLLGSLCSHVYKSVFQSKQFRRAGGVRSSINVASRSTVRRFVIQTFSNCSVRQSGASSPSEPIGCRQDNNTVVVSRFEICMQDENKAFIGSNRLFFRVRGMKNKPNNNNIIQVQFITSFCKKISSDLRLLQVWVSFVKGTQFSFLMYFLFFVFSLRISDRKLGQPPWLVTRLRSPSCSGDQKQMLPDENARSLEFIMTRSALCERQMNAGNTTRGCAGRNRPVAMEISFQDEKEKAGENATPTSLQNAFLEFRQKRQVGVRCVANREIRR